MDMLECIYGCPRNVYMAIKSIQRREIRQSSIIRFCVKDFRKKILNILRNSC